MRRSHLGERLKRPDNSQRFSSQSQFWDLLSSSPHFGYQPDGWGYTDEQKLAAGLPLGIDYHGDALVFEVPEGPGEDSTESLKAFAMEIETVIEVNDEDGAEVVQKRGYSGRIVIRKKDPNDPILVRESIAFFNSDIDVYFVNPLSFGELGAVRLKGNVKEFHRGLLDPDTDLRVLNTGANPAVRNDVYENEDGRMVLPLRTFETGDQAPQFQVGDWVVIRGYVSRTTGSALDKQYTRVHSIDLENNAVIMEDGIGVYTSSSNAAERGVEVGDPFIFLKDYLDENGDKLLHPISGSEVTTRVKVVAAAFAEANMLAGDTEVVVNNASIFSVGDVVVIEDDLIEQDLSVGNTSNGFANEINTEIVRIADVDLENDTIMLEQPLARQYLTSARCRLIVMDAVKNSSLNVKKVSWYEAQISRNTHPVQLDYCVDCHARVGEINGYNMKIAQGVRISYSYNCLVRDSVLFGNGGFGSGEAYGFTLYYATKCRIENCYSSGARHSYLLQATTDCVVAHSISTDCYITAIDTHGTACIGSHIYNNRCTTSESFAASNKCGIRIGNSSHVVSDRISLIENNFVFGYTDDGSSGLEVVGPSAKAVFQGNLVLNCDHGFQNSGQNTTRNPTLMTIQDVMVKDNIFMDCPTGIEIGSTSKGLVRNAIVKGNLIQNSTDYLKFDTLTSLVVEGNTCVDVNGTIVANPVDVDNVTNLFVLNNGEPLGAENALDLAGFISESSSALLLAGFTSDDYDLGTISTGTLTPNALNSNFQNVINNGAHTLAPPTANCAIVLVYENGASAGAVTTSGFTKVSGDTLTTTENHKFMMHICVCAGDSTLEIRALQ